MKKRRLGSILISAALIVILAVFLINLKEGSSRAPADAVALSEIMISNKGSVPDNLGGYPDYIELHNGSTERADISGYGLSDSLLEGAKYVFPAGTVLEPDAYVVVWCGGEAEDGMPPSNSARVRRRCCSTLPEGPLIRLCSTRWTPEWCCAGRGKYGHRQSPAPAIPRQRRAWRSMRKASRRRRI